MAALLRSARLVKISPNSLLQLSSGRANGAAFAQLRCLTISGRGTGVCRAGLASALGVNRCRWQVGAVRPFGLAPEQRGISQEEPGSAVRSRQAQQFDWALSKLDGSVRRTGRITKTLLLRIFHDICRAGSPSGNQALLLLRSCGSLLPEMQLSERTELVHRIWDKLQELGAVYDASHYNALLKVYLQNDFKFSPTEFLAKMEAARVQPNRVTYQRLIAAFCQEGDIDGASKILGFMKSKDLPITEAVFNSLVTGHARAGDMGSAENILSVMTAAGIEPGPDTYLALLKAYAEKGQMDKITQALETVEKTEASLMDRDLMEIIFTLAKAGHHQHVPEVVERMRHDRGYVPDAMNLCLSLITQGQEDTAFQVLKTFPTLHAENQSTDSPDLGNFFLRHCVNMDKPLEKLLQFCKDLQESNLHSSALHFTLYCALDAKKTGLAVELMKKMKEQGLPVRQHYFWPLLTRHQKDKNVEGTLAVLKAMQELGLQPDVDTYSDYILPTFPSLERAQAALQENGCSVDMEGFSSSQLKSEAASGRLSSVLAMLSSPTFPALDLSAFRSSLLQGFRRSDDVESMVKITDLLYRDERYSQTPEGSAEAVAYLIYNLFDSMREVDVQAKEDKLRQFLHGLKSTDIKILPSIFRGICNLLDSYHVPELVKDVLPLVDETKKDSADYPRGLEFKISSLETKLAELKAENKPVRETLKQLILALCAEENLARALELRAEHEADMAVGSYAILINLCCRRDNPEEALNLKREINRKDSSIALDANKYFTLVKVLAKHGQLDEAVEILREVKEKNVSIPDQAGTAFFHILNGAALRKDEVAVCRLQEAIFSLGLAKPTANLCSPLITVHMERDDMPAALQACMDCYKQYNQLPRLHDVLCRLVENSDTDLLQKAMDFVSQERGEMTMLYDLFFAFLQTGKYKEARKIIETPGLRSRPGRLQWFAEKCIATSQVEVLENMVELTQKLFECDRDEMYHYMLRVCKDTGDWRKADTVWTRMQEENVIPRERTLRLLAGILKSNGQEVPFELPEVWHEEDTAQGRADPEPAAMDRRHSALPVDSPMECQQRLLALCKRGKTKEAYKLLQDAEKKGLVLSSSAYNSLLKSLLADGNLEDAMTVIDIAGTRIGGFSLSDTASSLLVITQAKRDRVRDALASLRTMLQNDQVPSQLAITRVVQAFGAQGDLEGIQAVEDMVMSLGSSINLSRMLFINNRALAHIRNGNLEAAVEGLESFLTPGGEGSAERVSSVSFVFRKVLEDNQELALDKLSAMVERLAHHFSSYRPATDLFLQFLDCGRTDDAKHLLQRCPGVGEQKEILVSYMSRVARSPGQAHKIKALTEALPDFAEKETVYAYLMKCYGQDSDVSSAKALYQQMQAEGVQPDELSLKRFATLLKSADEPVPFVEPLESFKFYANKLKNQGREPDAPKKN
ncbi:leucine-rich PPR motif-containing protein, mitochondrial [Amia ocellicauda]|uniref:leucine-rich PPR motif-containing protein, mitochondrial n=1 Tax=Amia ocellicauda TaxID=2972642 RepID=UPI003463BDEF